MQSFILGVLTFIRGGWGVSLITLAVICCFLAAAAQLLPPRVGFVAFASELMAWLASFLITSYMQAV
ncbi:hypothetical protein [Belnapia moabensis]|uniref:hypothetical protein n=1 Tax=Belnapia moabensis TaxID=365533 RepID=UPI0005B787E8|nr:hypothetical protein [Belnapia moabensis]